MSIKKIARKQWTSISTETSKISPLSRQGQGKSLDQSLWAMQTSLAGGPGLQITVRSHQCCLQEVKGWILTLSCLANKPSKTHQELLKWKIANWLLNHRSVWTNTSSTVWLRKQTTNQTPNNCIMKQRPSIWHYYLKVLECPRFKTKCNK